MSASYSDAPPGGQSRMRVSARGSCRRRAPDGIQVRRREPRVDLARPITQVALRIHRRAIHAHLEVEVRSGDPAGRPDGSDHVTAAYPRALARVDRREVSVETR